jgi:hypothetical protein
MLVAVREKLDEIQAAYAIKLAEFEASGHEIRDGGVSDKERAALLAEFDKVVAKHRYEMGVYEKIRADMETELASTKKCLAEIELDLKTTAAEEAEEVVWEP